MVFSSTIFLFLFLPIVLLGYYLIDVRYKNVFLLLVSLGFYAWGEPKFVFVMILSIAINYLSGLLIHHVRLKNNKSLSIIALWIAILLNLSILFYFKYFDFFARTTNTFFGTNIGLLSIALPIGISFFTFQGMSYVIDLHMGKVVVQKNPINIALYIALFPQLIAGPIVRYIDINQQIDKRVCNIDKFADGTKRFIIGLAKKVILSNNFAMLADRAFDSTDNISVLMAWLGVVSYAIQIYFDFSGYSDMAIGLGKMLGFEFLENFNYPYISKSITEFWRRWHISLSSWFRDYIYIPLGGNRRGNVYFNLLVVFFVTGLWHGASWNFIIWGLWHGMFLIIERIFRKNNINIKIPRIIRWVYTMLIVLVGWVLFRAPSLTPAFNYIASMIGVSGNQLTDGLAIALVKDNIVTFTLAFICSTPIVPYIRKLSNEYLIPYRFKMFFSPIGYIILFIISITYTVTSTYNPFIYFNF